MMLKKKTSSTLGDVTSAIAALDIIIYNTLLIVKK